ncbi:hypothetical protein RhoFasGS6_03942 [Rhodococcus fascians]|nr:hypothetical protein [Rhodococcus fascians]
MAWQNGTSRTSSPRHRAWRLAVLERDGWTCRINGPRCLGRATIADHIKNVAERPDLEFDTENGQAACQNCSDSKTAEEARRGQERYRNRGKYQPATHTHPGLM